MARWLLLAAPALAFDCIATAQTLTLEECENLTVPVRQYEIPEVCSNKLYGQSFALATEDLQTILYGFTLEELRDSSHQEFWTACRNDPRTSCQYLSGLDGDAATAHPTEYAACYNDADRSPNACDLQYASVTSLEHQRCKSLKARQCLQEIMSGPPTGDVNTFWGLQNEKQTLQDSLSGNLAEMWQSVQAISDDLETMRTNMLRLGQSIQDLGILHAYHTRLASKMSEVNQCSAGLASAYRDLVSKNEDGAAEEKITNCNSLLDESMTTMLRETNCAYCDGTPEYCSAGSRKLLSFEEARELQDAADAAAVTAQCLAEAGYTRCADEATCEYNLLQQVEGECAEFDGLYKEVYLLRMLKAIVDNSRSLALSTRLVANNTDYLSEGLAICASEATRLYDIYRENAEDLVKVATCQQIIAEEYNNVLEECIAARGTWIYVPFYNLRFLSHLCTEFWAKVVGIIITAVTVFILLQILYMILRRTVCGRQHLDKLHELEIQKLRGRLEYLEAKYGSRSTVGVSHKANGDLNWPA